jgi:hypothetical protein
MGAARPTENEKGRNEMNKQLTDFGAVCAFIFAGKATFTVVSKKTGTRFTYKVTRKEGTDWTDRKGNVHRGKPIHFAAVMIGPDNESSFSYLGFFKEGQGYAYGTKSKIGPDAPSAKAFDWFICGLLSDKGLATLEQVEFWHEGSCARCGRKLTVPESIESGWGPECRQFRAEAA